MRQALSYGIERSQLQKVFGGAEINPALTHVLPAGIDGSQDVPADYNPYPYNQDKAKSMLAAAGFTASHPLQIKFLYRSDSQGSTAIFNNVVTQLNALGSVKVTGVPTNQSDFYGKYLYVPQQPGQPVARLQGHLGHGERGLGPGLVRELGGDASSTRCTRARAASRRTAAATSVTSPAPPSTT